jgi:hypothetical protein
VCRVSERRPGGMCGLGPGCVCLRDAHWSTRIHTRPHFFTVGTHSRLAELVSMWSGHGNVYTATFTLVYRPDIH